MYTPKQKFQIRKLIEQKVRKSINEAIIDQNALWDIVDQMKEYLGAEELLDSLIRAMSTDTAVEYLEYISRMNDLDINFDEDEEFEDEDEEFEDEY